MYFEIEELPLHHKWSLTIGETGSEVSIFILDKTDMKYLANLLKEAGF